MSSSQVFSRLKTTSSVPSLPVMNVGNTLDNVIFSREKVLSKLKKLKTGKAPGPDGWHPRILREVAEAIAQPLSLLFQLSFESDDFPEEWRTGHITPIHKKGSKRIPGNYIDLSA